MSLKQHVWQCERIDLWNKRDAYHTAPPPVPSMGKQLCLQVFQTLSPWVTGAALAAGFILLKLQSRHPVLLRQNSQLTVFENDASVHTEKKEKATARRNKIMQYVMWIFHKIILVEQEAVKNRAKVDIGMQRKDTFSPLITVRLDCPERFGGEIFLGSLVADGSRFGLLTVLPCQGSEILLRL